MTLREEIIKHIDDGQNDIEIYSSLLSNDHLVLPSDLIGVIREILTERAKG